jgi:hypothetical protein
MVGFCITTMPLHTIHYCFSNLCHHLFLHWVPILDSALYWPFFNPCKIFLFSNLKFSLKRTHFQFAETTQKRQWKVFHKTILRADSMQMLRGMTLNETWSKVFKFPQTVFMSL